MQTKDYLSSNCFEYYPGGIPVTVGVTMFILSIGDLSEKFMDFTFDMYFRQVNTYDSRAFASRHIPS